MEQKKYSEYRRLTLIEPPCLFYILMYTITILVVFIVVACMFFLPTAGNNDTSTEWVLLTFLIIFIHSVYRHSRERALIHSNGKLEVYGYYKHQDIPIKNINQIHFKRRWTICGNVLVIVLELNNKNTIELLLKDNEQFLEELKSHNPNIIIPELPLL